MKRTYLFLLMTVLLVASCGTSSKIYSTKKGIKTSFFGSTLGDSFGQVESQIERNDFGYFLGRVPSYVLDPVRYPMTSIKVKTQRSSDGKFSFGDWNWGRIGYLFDFKDRFFCMCFINEYRTSNLAKAQMNELKETLDAKYGTGITREDGAVIYGNPSGLCVILAVTTNTKKEAACCLYYIDYKLYNKDTAMAMDEY